MKLDFSKLTAHMQINVGRMGHLGQPITARLPVSHNRTQSNGTTWDKPATGRNDLEPVLVVDAICPKLSHVCPTKQNSANPCESKLSQVSHLSHDFLGESEKTATDLPALCDLLGLSWERAEAQMVFDSYDRGRIDSGGYSALWVIRYLLSWQAGGCCVPFGLLRDEVITQHIEKLQLTQPDGETVNQWLSVNIRNKTGGRP